MVGCCREKEYQFDPYEKMHTMRVLIATECRYMENTSGEVYAEGALGYAVARRYTQVFEDVSVLARFTSNTCRLSDRMTVRADGPGVSFVRLPDYRGSRQYLLKYLSIRSFVKKAVDSAQAVILRVPGQIGTIAWRELQRQGRPFGVEVVGDPWDVFAKGSYPSRLRPILRRVVSRNLVAQCQDAVAAAYVTSEALQRRYPPGGWSTHYSSVDLPTEAFVRDMALRDRFLEWTALSQSRDRPWRLVFVGGMSHLYKAPQVLLDAAAACKRAGLEFEIAMLGDGTYRLQLERQAVDLGLGGQVHFLGRVPAGASVRRQLRHADLFVLPSFQEGLPRAMIEAMAQGLPCIGSDVGGIPELLPTEDMVRPADVFALASKIRDVLSDPDRMVKMAHRNLEKAAEYQEDILQKRRIAFYQRVREASDEWMKRKP